MPAFCRSPRFARLLAVALLALGTPLLGAQEAKTCAALLVAAKSGPAAIEAMGRKLQPVCTARLVQAADLARQVRNTRQQGFKRVVLIGHGAGANAVITFAGSVGDTEGVVALGGDVGGEGGDLATGAAAIRQHVPLLWVVGTQDPLHARGESYAFAKAPPHPASRHVSVKADAAGTPEAAVKTVAEWLRDLQ